MRLIPGSATLPDSRALRGMNPQQTMVKMMASKRSAKSASKGQLINTDLAGLVFRLPLPKCCLLPRTMGLLDFHLASHFSNIFKSLTTQFPIFFPAEGQQGTVGQRLAPDAPD